MASELRGIEEGHVHVCYHPVLEQGRHLLLKWVPSGAAVAWQRERCGSLHESHLSWAFDSWNAASFS